MNLNITGKNAIITASSKGIGKSIAEYLLNEGCNVTICSSNKSNIKSAADELQQKTGKAPFFGVCDINNEEDISEIIKLAEDHFGAVDILVNNCGGPVPGIFEQLNDSDWESAVTQVLMSVVRMTRGVLEGMKNKKWGRIINITSLSVKQPVDNLLLSNSLRSAVTAFAKTLSNDVGKHNITVNNVAPGYTKTSRLDELAIVRGKASGKTPDEILNEMANLVPLKRLAMPEEIAAMVAFLASEQAGYITGTTIQVDGGVIKSTY